MFKLFADLISFHLNAIEQVNNSTTKLHEERASHKEIEKNQKAFSAELEEQVVLRTKQLEQNNEALEKMNKELQSFAYISSHDLQEPLRKIQTFSHAILEKDFDNLSEKGKDYFNRMRNAAQRMQVLINDLLSYSRTNTMDRKFEKTNLNDILEDVKADLYEELEKKEATIAATYLAKINLIPFQFRQLIFNLISNSLKFAKPGVAPHILITNEIANGLELNNDQLQDNVQYCHIRFSDNGIGFEQEYNEKIFGLFQRLHDRTQYQGTGIGLTIVKKIVDNHSGFINAKSELGKGATFNIYIPTNLKKSKFLLFYQT